MTFYVAGHLVAQDRSSELYPQANLQSFTDTPFDRAAHALLPHLPQNATGAYMNMPLVAAFFAPFSYLDPNLALFLWQVLSVVALALGCHMLSQTTGIKTSELFFLSFLFLPVFLTLWAGQLGLVFGFLPLCLGYLLLLKKKFLAAGLVWSFLIAKPQYLIVGLFVALVSALHRRYGLMVGLVMGVLSLVALTLAIFPLPLTLQWLASHRVSDAYFFAGEQGIPSHLLTGLPANILVLLPLDQRGNLKWLLYAGAAATWLWGIWFCFRRGKGHWEGSMQISSAFAMGLILTSLTLPHLLYYDLCVLLPAGALLLASRRPFTLPRSTRFIALAGWVTISAFLPILLAFSGQKVLPLILELLLLGLFIALLVNWPRVAQRQPV